MKVCFPVENAAGLESAVFGHFGSAPYFVMVDTATDAVTVIDNGDRNHQHGACNPVSALGGRQVDAVIVGGIGAGALGKLNQLGIRVHRAQAPSIRENLALFTSGALPEYALQSCCGGHGHDGGCSHH